MNENLEQAELMQVRQWPTTCVCIHLSIKAATHFIMQNFKPQYDLHEVIKVNFFFKVVHLKKRVWISTHFWTQPGVVILGTAVEFAIWSHSRCLKFKLLTLAHFKCSSSWIFDHENRSWQCVMREKIVSSLPYTDLLVSSGSTFGLFSW